MSFRRYVVVAVAVAVVLSGLGIGFFAYHLRGLDRAMESKVASPINRPFYLALAKDLWDGALAEEAFEPYQELPRPMGQEYRGAARVSAQTMERLSMTPLSPGAWLEFDFKDSAFPEVVTPEMGARVGFLQEALGAGGFGIARLIMYESGEGVLYIVD